MDEEVVVTAPVVEVPATKEAAPEVKVADATVPAAEGETEALSTEAITHQNSVMLASLQHPDAAGIKGILSDLSDDGVNLTLFAEAAATGDLSKVDMAALAEQLGSKVAARAVIAQLEGEKSRLESKQAESAKAVMDAVGGEEAWGEAKAWAQLPGAIDATDRAELNAMLAQGGRAAMLAAKEFMRMYKESSVYAEDGSVVPPDIVAAAGGKDLFDSRMDYSRALQESAGDPQKVAAINKRWLMSKAAGKV